MLHRLRVEGRVQTSTRLHQDTHRESLYPSQCLIAKIWTTKRHRGHRLALRNRKLKTAVASNGTLPVKVCDSPSRVRRRPLTAESLGLSLLNLAAQEDSIRPRRRRSRSLSRQLYVHGLTYLLRGLPTNMSPEEKISVWAAVPRDVLDLSQVHSTSKEAVRAAEQRLAEQNGEEPPSFLHRALATFIVQLFILFQFLVPYINIFVAAAYKYERQHRISERVFASSVNTMDGMVKSMVRLGNSLCQMNDGKVGQALNDLICWWIRGITGGVHCGVQEGLVVLGIERPRKQEAEAKP